MTRKRIDLSGKIFGEWTVLEYSYSERGQTYWLCRCSCGKEKTVSAGTLRDGRSMGCGHYKRADLSGATFGEWVVIGFSHIGESGDYYWECRCSCGKIKPVSYGSLIGGKSKSCGHFDDISGSKFGRLFVLNYSHSTKGGHTIWECQCDCGNKILVDRTELVRGNTISCGCYRIEHSSEIASQTAKKYKNHFGYQWYFYDIDGKKVRCDSSYEVLFWNYYRYFLKEQIKYQPETFVLSKNRRYTPDFYLPNDDLWIELKGSFERFGRKTQVESIEKFKIDHNFRILFWKELVELCKLPFKSFTVYKNKAKKIGKSLEEYLAEGLYSERGLLNYESNFG